MHLGVCLNDELENKCAQGTLDIQDLMNLVFQRTNDFENLLVEKSPNHLGFGEVKLRMETATLLQGHLMEKYRRSIEIACSAGGAMHGTAVMSQGGEAYRGWNEEGRVIFTKYCWGLVDGCQHAFIYDIYFPNTVDSGVEKMQSMFQLLAGNIQEQRKKYGDIAYLVQGDFNLLLSKAEASSHPKVAEIVPQLLKPGPFLESFLKEQKMADLYQEQHGTAEQGARGHYTHYFMKWNTFKSKNGT